MKKILLILLLIPLAGCTTSKKENIGKNIELDIKNCEIEKEKDTHAGFLGDGEYFAQIKCENIEEQIKENWKTLPLTENLKEIMNMETCDDKECLNPLEKYNIPEIKEGYYYFLDRHQETTNKNDDTKINERASYNLTIALYNKKTKTIYYYELDT